MMTERDFGFYEIEHTADWALYVWAPNPSLLFVQAAQGMYWLMEISLLPGGQVERVLDLEEEDLETLLVAFLSELLYLGESEGLGFDKFEISLEGQHLHAVVRGGPIVEQRKEIKAVTFHNLAVRQTEKGFEVTVVFDV
jgi:SHS2 domain-containing protein